MLKKSLTFSAVLALITITRIIPITAQPRDAQPNAKPTTESQRSQQAQAPETNQQKRADSTTLVAQRLIEPPATKPQPKTPTSETQRQWELWENRFRRAFTPTYWSNWVLVAFSVLGIGVAVCTLLAISREVAETGKAAQAAADSADAAKDTLATNREIERAYIAISHESIVLAESRITGSRPSSRHRTNDPNADAIEFVAIVKNHGRTPGDVLGGYCTFIYETADIGPDLRRVTSEGPRLTGLFLLPNASVDFAMVKVVGQAELLFLTNEHPYDAANERHLWFVGEVDYRDRFKAIHRGGYCRRYDKIAHNFVSAPETAALNYDRSLSAAEIKHHGYKS